MAWLFAMDTIWHWLVAAHLVLVPLLSVPTLQKAGWKAWWFFLWYVPLVNVVFLWIFAFANWPNEPRKAAEDTGQGPSHPECDRPSHLTLAPRKTAA